MLLVAFPITAQVLPAAVLNGLSRAPRPVFQAVWLAAVAVALLAWLLEARGKRVAAVLAVAAGAALGIGYLKTVATPELDRSVSARGLWREIGGRAGDVCIGNVKRDWEYGLNYYSVTPLPDRARSSRSRSRCCLRPGGRAYLGTRSLVPKDPGRGKWVDPHYSGRCTLTLPEPIHDPATKLFRGLVFDGPQLVVPGILGERIQVRREVAFELFYLDFAIGLLLALGWYFALRWAISDTTGSISSTICSTPGNASGCTFSSPA